MLSNQQTTKHVTIVEVDLPLWCEQYVCDQDIKWPRKETTEQGKEGSNMRLWLGLLIAERVSFLLSHHHHHHHHHLHHYHHHYNNNNNNDFISKVLFHVKHAQLRCTMPMNNTHTHTHTRVWSQKKKKEKRHTNQLGIGFMNPCTHKPTQEIHYGEKSIWAILVKVEHRNSRCWKRNVSTWN